MLEDENGEKINIIKLKDAVVPDVFLKGQMGKFKLNDLRKMPIRDDDILLCSYAKTGAYCFFVDLFCFSFLCIFVVVVFVFLYILHSPFGFGMVFFVDFLYFIYTFLFRFSNGLHYL